MESFGILVSELDLVKEKDSEERIEEAFEGFDMEEKEELNFEEFMTIARRLAFKKRQDKDNKRMADISEAKLHEVFKKNKKYNEALDEDCLSMSACYDSLRLLRIKMNPREYEKKFFEFDINRDRFISLEEFRRFLGKEPKE